MVETSLSNNFFNEGYELSLQNAVNLLHVADEAALGKNYGVACSLNVLAAEEALKASFLNIKHHHPTGEINEFDRIFYKHTVKHKELRRYVEFQIKLQSDLKAYAQFYSPIVTNIIEFNKKFLIHKKDDLDSLNENLSLLKKHSDINLNLDGIILWLENANNIKNKGFYVDKLKTSWSAPQNVSVEQFENERKYTIAIIDYVKSIAELFLLMQELRNLH